MSHGRHHHGRHRVRIVGISVKPNPWLIATVFTLILAAGASWTTWRGMPGWSIYGAAVAALLSAKLVLSLLPEKRWTQLPDRRVAVVIPFYNEDPATLLRALQSIGCQTYPVAHVYVIDDGSTNPAARRVAEQWAVDNPGAVVSYQPNAGKRAAMGQAFRELEGQVDVFVCVDSDTVLEADAIQQGISPFSDPDVAAVTGTVVALNPEQGLLPRLLDLRYVNAFLYERAAYSRLGSVLCVCGSLAFWRADIISRHLDDFLNQKFLGQDVVAGDDRHLTNLSLMHGKVVLARRALARTIVPEKGGHLIRQQIRWGKSFFRESWWALTHLSPRRVAFWLAAVESVSWAGFTLGLLTTVVAIPLITGHFLVADYLAWIFLAGYGRSVHVFSIRRPDWSRWEQVGAFLLAPVYGVMHVLLLVPLRMYSLATLRSTQWGTRSTVEVDGGSLVTERVLTPRTLVRGETA